MNTLVELLNRSFAKHADKIAVRVLRPKTGSDLYYEPITYEQLKQMRDKVAAGLAQIGLSKGQRLGILTDGGLEPLIAFLASDMLGVSCVPLCLKNSPEVLAYNICHSGIKMLIVDQKGSDCFAELSLNEGNVPKLIKTKKVEDGSFSWEDISECESDITVVDLASSDETKVLYTSGSSGMPKGVIQTHANIIANVEEVWDVVSPREDLRFFKSAPDYHAMGILNIYYPLAKGWTLDMARSPDRALNDIRHSQPHAFLTVPLILDKVFGNVRKAIQSGGVMGSLIQSAVDSKRRIFCGNATMKDKMFNSLIGDRIVAKIRKNLSARVGSNLELLIVGSAKADPEALDFFHEVLNIQTYEGYGATECAPLIATNHLKGRIAGTVGRPLIRVRIVDSKGKELATGDPATNNYSTNGQHGELWASGPNVMRGYLNDPEETDRVLVKHEGSLWYKTGDLFSMDAQGFLTFRGRIGRQFKLRNGEFVNPEMLERIFSRAPLVEHVLVCGDQHRDFPLPLVVVDLDEAKKNLPAGVSPDEDGALFQHPDVGERVRKQLLLEANENGLPDYERPRKILLLPEPLSEEDGTLTRGLKKIIPAAILERYSDQISAAYE
ncbi:MAG: AMP-binding protein [Candidatus Latescibacterota bacterium]|nr:AMP-binding protein [Candidatus Latescibacterota bacterium]